MWPVIIRGIAEVTAGQGDTLLKILDVFGGRDEDGTHPNFSEALYAVNCMDEDRNTPEEEVELKRRIQEIAPFTDAGLGPEGLVIRASSGRPSRHSEFPTHRMSRAFPDTLTISITGDPSTPYEGGVNLADTLGGTLLPVDGEQHTVAISGANAWWYDIVADYLVELATPEAGTRCTL